MKWECGAVALVFVVTACAPPQAPVAAAPEAPAAAATQADEPKPAPSMGPAQEPSRPKKTPSPVTRPVRSAALAALAAVEVKGRAPMTGYSRDRYGQAWLDADRNGCDTRNDVLTEHLTEVVLKPNSCRVLSGVYADPYTGERIDYVHGDGHLIDIDHVVAMGNSWATGAARWDIRKRAAFANDPLNLLPAEAWANRQKGDSDAASWLPPRKAFRCEYVARQVAVKRKFGLWVTAPEASAIRRVLAGCPGQSLPRDRWRAPTRVDHDITDPGAPGKKSAPKTLLGKGNGTRVQPKVAYENCTAARAAGAAPVHRGDPGYGDHLDRDGDGVACE